MHPSSFLRRANPTRRRVICLTGVLALGLSYGQAAQAEEATPASIAVHMERGLLSVDARDAPLGDVLEAIAKQADFRLDTKGDLDIPVTWSFAGVPVDKGVQRLLHRISSVIVYARVQDDGAEPLAKVTTLRRIRRPSATSVNNLALHVSPDDDPVGRRIAAIGLGKLGTPEAKAALREALSDEDSLVRRRAIQGLGKTWPSSP